MLGSRCSDAAKFRSPLLLEPEVRSNGGGWTRTNGDRSRGVEEFTVGSPSTQQRKQEYIAATQSMIYKTLDCAALHHFALAFCILVRKICVNLETVPARTDALNNLTLSKDWWIRWVYRRAAGNAEETRENKGMGMGKEMNYARSLLTLNAAKYF